LSLAPGVFGCGYKWFRRLRQSKLPLSALTTTAPARRAPQTDTPAQHQRRQLSALEAQRRGAARASEAALAAELARLEDRAREEKLRQVAAVEAAYQVGVTNRSTLLCN